MTNTTLKVRPASGAVGAIISGVDLSKPQGDDTYREIRATLNQYGVVFFRDQTLTPEQHLALGAKFGEIYMNPVIAAVPGYSNIAEVRKEPEQKISHGGAWHADEAFSVSPPLGSILLARQIPYGGDTMFASMGRAYDTLSDGLKKTLEGLRVVHRISKRLDNDTEDTKKRRAKPEDRNKGGTSPAVIRHPESGRKILWLTPMYTTQFEGWTVEESTPLLQYLFQHATEPENIYRFQWEEGSIAFWDNRQTWHYAIQDYDGSRRVMHRVSIKGSPLF